MLYSMPLEDAERDAMGIQNLRYLIAAGYSVASTKDFWEKGNNK